jgi:hypothetical protein
MNTKEPARALTNVVSTSDPLTSILGGWGKYGETVGFEHDQGLLENFYGGTSIGQWWTALFPYRGFLKAHTLESYVAHVFSHEPNVTLENNSSWGAKYRATSVECPTDVSVFRSDQLVASVIGNESTNEDPDVAITTNEAGEKFIVTPDSAEYRIVAEATADGTMRVSTSLFGYDIPLAELGEPEVLTIASGEVYELDFETGRPRLVGDSSNSGESDGSSDSESPVVGLRHDEAEDPVTASKDGELRSASGWVAGGVCLLLAIAVSVVARVAIRRRRRTSDL